MRISPKAGHSSLSDAELAALLAKRDAAAVRVLTSTNNQRLIRTAWSILRNRAEAEDAVQSAYLKAIASIDSFNGLSSLSTWLTRIVINEALGRMRSEKRRRARLDPTSVVHLDEYREALMRGSAFAATPERTVAIADIRRLIEAAVAKLPVAMRLVFILRDVEGMSVDDASQALGVVPATVKTRLFRARRMLQAELAPELRSTLVGTFPFAGPDCERLTERLLENLGWPAAGRTTAQVADPDGAWSRA